MILSTNVIEILDIVKNTVIRTLYKILGKLINNIDIFSSFFNFSLYPAEQGPSVTTLRSTFKTQIYRVAELNTVNGQDIKYQCFTVE